MLLREYLKSNRILADGAFGTYFTKKYELEILPELANTMHPELVRQIHEEYIEAGARLIRTNTFAANRENLHLSLEGVLQNVTAAYEIARKSSQKVCGLSEDEQVYIAGDIGPITHHHSDQESDVIKEYLSIAEQFISLGADALVFETFPDNTQICEVIRQIRKSSDIVIWVQFSVNQLGYTSAGMSAKSLYQEMAAMDEVDIVGFNCGVGPGHMNGVIAQIAPYISDKVLSVFPNAGYPKVIRDKVVFAKNIDYFVDKVVSIACQGAQILGGCCGTDPEYIRALGQSLGKLGSLQEEKEKLSAAKALYEVTVAAVKDNKDVAKEPKTQGAFFDASRDGKKLIAVELSPPLSAEDDHLIETAKRLKNLNVDTVTFPDSPSGRTRADSILMASKVKRETGLCVMPHICCRDKNAIAMRSQLLGAHINEIRNLLVITGDPIPTMARNDIKSVFNFDSVGLMKILKEMNKEQFEHSPFCYGGAINQNRLNLDVETRRIGKKMEAGAQFFFTQPIFTEKEAESLRQMKKETGARILCGIMPLISQKNALFIKNEMVGMNVTDEIVARYEGAVTRQDGEKQGILLAKDIMKMTEDFADGYYFSIPFNRGYLLEDIL